MVRGQLRNVVNTVLVARARSSHKIAEASDTNFGFKGGTTGMKLLVPFSIPKFVPERR